MRVAIRVKPGASRTRVGGAYGGALVVAVSARAVDGAATEAALAAVADAFGVRRRHVDLVTGATSRDKVVELDDTALDDGPARLAELRDG
ncbi:hypothetical protein CWIS_12235 [Cellulomonas sp. A375-1]|uniref:DUF167 domain-containing protein n=1 Tax=Cellulomonas sp. A375-1 TaxID=1672219 RepID=UPI0006528257|nr:DUF167 domain-containing protein [Cellulomonas sp. A375-1]KMM45170.1 hypothetical protein CWIS_12235 [Cellulomonas sp. A375-1]